MKRSAARTRALETRALVAQAVRHAMQRPSDAAIHEAAHEHVARLVGCRDIGAFVDRNGESGRTYFQLGSSFIGEDGRRYRRGLTALRHRARVLMAGWVAEHIAYGDQVPDYEALLELEGRDRPDENPLLPFVAHAAEEFSGDVDRAVEWLERALPEARQETIYDLRRAWPQIHRRARELNGRRNERV